MKAALYLVACGDVWDARISIDWSVDSRFWLDGDFREGLAEALVPEPVLPQADVLLVWPGPLPLGQAVEAAARWNGEAHNRPRSHVAAAAALERCVRNASGGDSGRSAQAGAASQAVRVLRPERGSAGPRTAQERAASRAAAAALAAHAERAALALQGRALLRGEAHALLDGAAEPPAAGWDAALQLAALLGRLRLRSAVAAERRALALLRRRPHGRCLRCGSGEARMRRTPCASCGRRQCAYCEACLAMGRSRECELLVLGGAAATLARQAPSRAERLGRWGLSPAQRDAAEAALRYIEADAGSPAAGHRRRLRHAGGIRLEMQPGTGQSSPPSVQPPPDSRNTTERSQPDSPNTPERRQSVKRNIADRWQSDSRSAAVPKRFLLWAVTGAGKTEMIFPLLESVLLRGGRALIATPRRDVVLELDPRVRRAFPDRTVVTLYGGSAQRWEAGDLVLATTHQLLRFERAFQLVVIDELDAFPFHGDPMLHYAAAKACSATGTTVLLSATPPAELQLAARSGRLPHARVPVRYHRRPLPVPRMMRVPAVSRMLRQGRIPAQLVRAVADSVARGAQVFVFVQQIRHAGPLARRLQSLLPGVMVASTSSQDAGRTETVQSFRNRAIRVLVTTTILERGVTVPRSDVIILDADGKLFDAASLVQMAGRAGRSADDPYGRVLFAGSARSRQQVSAIRHIRAMNRLAKRSGYLLPP